METWGQLRGPSTEGLGPRLCCVTLGWLANLSEPASPSEKAALSGAPDTSVLQPGCGRCMSQSSVPPSFESKVTVSHQTTRTSLHQARSAPPPTLGLRSDPGCVPRTGRVRPTEKLGGPWVVARGADAGSCRSPHNVAFVSQGGCEAQDNLGWGTISQAWPWALNKAAGHFGPHFCDADVVVVGGSTQSLSSPTLAPL